MGSVHRVSLGKIAGRNSCTFTTTCPRVALSSFGIWTWACQPSNGSLCRKVAKVGSPRMIKTASRFCKTFRTSSWSSFIYLKTLWTMIFGYYTRSAKHSKDSQSRSISRKTMCTTKTEGTIPALSGSARRHWAQCSNRVGTSKEIGNWWTSIIICEMKMLGLRR